jgi:hypothetical protein
MLADVVRCRVVPRVSELLIWVFELVQRWSRQLHFFYATLCCRLVMQQDWVMAAPCQRVHLQSIDALWAAMVRVIHLHS